MKVGIVGVTGLVGEKLLELLENTILPISELRLIASEKSSGKLLKYKDQTLRVLPLSDKVFQNLDLVFFMATQEISQEYAPRVAQNKCVVIDNSSCFRMEKDIPLVIPKVNFHVVKSSDYLIANPNCSTIQLVICLNALSKVEKINRVDVSTYQAVSGYGKEAVEELETQILNYRQKVPTKIFPCNILYNAIPQIDKFDLSTGYTKEELKVILESQKILGQKFEISCTAVRIPIPVGHSESVSITFANPVNIAKVKEVFQNEEEIIIMDDIENNIYPYAEIAKDKKEVFVGRIRKDYYNDHILHYFTVADNLVNGAASNALQIAETCYREKTFGW
ncbi:MAG TPA: aspartate-semialdehyde dehydrogenase [Haloplasmataceae bacterium]